MGHGEKVTDYHEEQGRLCEAGGFGRIPASRDGGRVGRASRPPCFE